jgi:hypothetical protein
MIQMIEKWYDCRASAQLQQLLPKELVGRLVVGRFKVVNEREEAATYDFVAAN